MFLSKNCLILTIFALFIINTKCDNKVVKKSETKFKGNILCLMTIASPSHHIWNRSLMEALAAKGYNITALSVDIDKEPAANLHYILIEDVYKAIYEEENFDLIAYASLDIYSSISDLMKYFAISNRAILRSQGLQTLLRYPDDFHFDLVVYDYSSFPSILGILQKFHNPPVVGVSAFMNPPNTYDASGNPIFASLKPYYATTFTPVMNFWERSLNLFYYVVDNWARKKDVEDAQELMEKVFGRSAGNARELERRIELFLVNVHASIDVPEPLLPNVIPVGGLQVKQPKEVPQDIKRFIESSKKGAVLFSLGSNVKSEMLGDERIRMFIKAFAKFPDYHFLWKFSNKDKLDLPKNVLLQDWMPQNDILGHPKTVLFMTHGGLLSTQESHWHGVPMLGIPFFADQHTNMKRSIDAGVAEKLDIFNLSEEAIIAKLSRMLSEPSYREKMTKRSSLFRDRPQHPLQEAVWWCEYVLRHKGAPHFKSQAVSMCPFALFMWDLLLVWLGVFLGALFLVFYGIKKIYCGKEKDLKASEALRKVKKTN